MTQQHSTGDAPAGNAQQLGAFVAGRANNIQIRFFNNSSSARADLAALRGGVAKPIGSDPRLWGLVFDGFPERLIGRSDAPNRFERAAYSALCLFGVHMQSARKPMHVAGVGFGAAVRNLAGRPDGDNIPTSVKRFQMLGTAMSLDESLHHARGLIQLMRADGVGLDYGMLARDLCDLQNTATENNVRLRWARQLYRNSPSPEVTTDEKTTKES